MKNQAGVTLTTLIVYIVGMLIVISIVATITNFAYENISFIGTSGKNATKYNIFNMYFLEDIKNTTNTLYSIQENKITLSDGTTYTFEDESIYRNNVKICSDISETKFSSYIDENTKNTIITVLFISGQDSEFSKTTNYTLINK